MSVLCLWTGVVALVIMVLSITVLVLLRYTIQYSPRISEDLSKFMMVLFTYLFSPYVYREHLHSGMEMLIESWWPWFQHFVKLLLHCLVVVLALFLLNTGIEFYNNGATLINPTFNITNNYFYWVVPASFLLLIPVAIELAIDEYTLLRSSL
ncbi:MAG: TRAP transporter small permease subunit [Methylacidiphilales bacterium]|nr:TRAP transporter small permease subunit [Candidatus Methylacidiphilales bacterium]